MAERVLIAGATGYLGGFVLQEAHRRGFRTRALARRARQLDALDSSVDELVVAEATQPESLRGICEGVHTVYSSLGITRQADGATYEDVDYGANHNLLREALSAGVKRFVFVSVIHPEYALHTDMVAAREHFVAELQASSMASVVIRPTGFFSDMADFFEMARSGRCYVIGDGSARFNPIHGADLARVCVDQFDRGEGVVEVGGPEALSQIDIANMAFSALGKEPKITRVPLWVLDGLLAVIKPFSRRWWNIGSFMANVGRHDLIGPAVGEHHLADWYRELAQR